MKRVAWRVMLAEGNTWQSRNVKVNNNKSINFNIPLQEPNDSTLLCQNEILMK